MAHWVDPAFQRDEEGYPTDKVDVCRTTCCIAGEAVLLDLLDSSVPHAVAISQLSVWDKAATGHVQHRAAELLDLPYSQTFMSPTPRLFFKEDWPIYYQDLAYVPWDQSDDPEYNHQAVAAAALMRDMTEEREYEVSVRNTFTADSPEQAVADMIHWLLDYAGQTGYRVTWMYEAFGDTTPQTMFVDADDLDWSTLA